MMFRTIPLLRLIVVAVAAPAMAGSSEMLSVSRIEQPTVVRPEIIDSVDGQDVAAASRLPAADAIGGGVAQGLLPQREPHKGVDEDMFKGHNWYTPPPPPPRRPATKPVRRKPVAPPLPFKLLGTFEQAGSPTLYFLVKEDRIYDATIGDTLESTYRVDRVSNGQLMFTYLPLKTSQGLRLGEEQ